MSWRIDKAWSDQFLSEIKMVLGLHLLGEPREEEDAERNTDLIVLKMEAARIGCRVRRAEYYESFGHEFTIRTCRGSGNKTELAKILEGWGDFFFYGFAAPVGAKLADWTIADLKVFRLWHHQYLAENRGKLPGKSRRNGDGSSDFRVYRWEDLPPSFIVARMSHHHLDLARHGNGMR